MNQISEYLIEQEKYKEMLIRSLEAQKATPENIKVHTIGSTFTVENKLTECKIQYSVEYIKNTPQFIKKEI